MGEDVAQRDAALCHGGRTPASALATGSSSAARPRSICCRSATEANGLVPEKSEKSVSERTRCAALGVGVAVGEIEDEPATVIDGQGRAGNESQRS